MVGIFSIVFVATYLDLVPLLRKGTSQNSFFQTRSWTGPSGFWVKYIWLLVLNDLVSDPVKSLPSRKSCDRSGWTMTSNGKAIVTPFRPSKWSTTLAMAVIAWVTPVAVTSTVLLLLCFIVTWVIFADSIKAEVLITLLAHPQSCKACMVCLWLSAEWMLLLIWISTSLRQVLVA